MPDFESVQELVGYFNSVWEITEDMLENYLGTGRDDWQASHIDRLKMLRLDLHNKAIEPEHLLL